MRKFKNILAKFISSKGLDRANQACGVGAGAPGAAWFGWRRNHFIFFSGSGAL